MAEQVSISIPQPLYRRVRELARLRNRPVDDVLIEVLDQAFLVFRSTRLLPTE